MKPFARLYLLLLCFMLLSILPAMVIAQVYYVKDSSSLNIFYGNNARPAISFPLQQAIATFEVAKAKVTSKLGSFKMNQSIEKRYERTTIDTIIKPRIGVLFISGKAWYNNESLSYTISFRPDNSGALSISVSTNNTAVNRVSLTFQSTANEHYFGGGEQFSHVDMKGYKVPFMCEEQGVGRGDKGISFITKLAKINGTEFTSYAPIPWFISTGKRGLFVDDYHYSAFDFTQPNLVTINVWNGELQAYIWQNDDPLKLIEQFTQYTGRMPKLPDWANGTILGLQGGKDKVLRIVDSTIKAGSPVSAVWIQDWVGKRATKFGSRLWWNWEPDTSKYGDIKTMSNQLAAKGIKLLGYINPFLAPEGKLGKIAATNGYVIKNAKGNNYLLAAGGFDAYLLDLTNPDAVKWMKGIIKTNLIGNGFNGWMADFAEWLPYDAVMYSKTSAEEYHNLYPVEWARLNREAIREAGKEGEIAFFNRSGFGRSASYSTLFWVGDQMHTYGANDGLTSAIHAIISGGMSGISINHSDIGGYTTIKAPMLKFVRDRDLFYRWAEVNAFMPVFRTHEGLKPEQNVQFYTDSASQSFFALMGQLHKALQPYFESLVQEATTKGYPIVRHPYLIFPNDTNTYTLSNQFMLGNDLLVAPVLTKNTDEVNLYLPEGTWQNVWTGKQLTGGKYYTVKATYGKPAVYCHVNGEWYDRLQVVFNKF